MTENFYVRMDCLHVVGGYIFTFTASIHIHYCIAIISALRNQFYSRKRSQYRYFLWGHPPTVVEIMGLAKSCLALTANSKWVASLSGLSCHHSAIWQSIHQNNKYYTIQTVKVLNTEALCFRLYKLKCYKHLYIMHFFILKTVLTNFVYLFIACKLWKLQVILTLDYDSPSIVGDSY